MKRFLHAMLALVALATAAVPARAEPLVETIAGRNVAVWKPSGDAPAGGHPLVVFSHGFTGCNTQSTFLMEALADAGYLVLAPDHADAGCGRGGAWYPGKLRHDDKPRGPQVPFQQPRAWSDATYRDRAEDIHALLDHVLASPSFEGVPVDAHAIGMSGHSLGGYTALGVAGAWPSQKDPRIRAVLALSPYCSPYVEKGSLGSLGIPVMYQGGTADLGITPTVRRPHGAYDLSSPPKYYVEIAGAGHFAWTELSEKHHAVIARYAVAFFDRYLKQKTGPDALKALFEGAPPDGVSARRANPQ